MEVYQSKVDRSSALFKENKAHHLKLREDLMERINENLKAGGEVNVIRHRERNKKLARERIEEILDEGSPVYRNCSIGGEDLYGETKVPSGGMVAGIGKVHGVDCMFVANDATVKGGTYFPITVKKHLRAQEIARENFFFLAFTWWIQVVLFCLSKMKFSQTEIILANLFQSSANVFDGDSANCNRLWILHCWWSVCTCHE